MQVEDDTQFATEHDDVIGIPPEHEGDEPDARNDDGELARAVDEYLTDIEDGKVDDETEPEPEDDADAGAEGDGEGDEPAAAEDGAGGAPGEEAAGEGDETPPAADPPAPQGMVQLTDGRVISVADFEAVYRYATEQLAAQPTPAQQVVQQPATPPVDQSPAPEFNPDDFDDPQLAKFVHDQMAQQQAVMQQLIAAQEAEQARVQQQALAKWEAELPAARDSIKTEFGITDAEVTRLEAIAEQAGTLPALLQRKQAQGVAVDERETLVEAMRMAAQMDPAFSGQLMEARVNAAVQAQLESLAQLEEKKAKAAAAGGGRPVKAKTKPAANRALTDEENDAALIAELAAAMNGSDDS